MNQPQERSHFSTKESVAPQELHLRNCAIAALKRNITKL